MFKRLIVVFYVLLLLQLPAFAQAPEGAPALPDVLRALVGPLAALVAGTIISVLIEFFARFRSLDKRWKYTVYFLLCLGLSVGAHVLGVAFGYWGAWNDPQGWWVAIWAGLAASGVGGLFHQWSPEAWKRSSSLS